MRGLGKSSRYVTRSLLLLGLLQWATTAQFDNVRVDAAETDLVNGMKTREMAEIEGSMARYGRFSIHEEFSLRNLLQVSEKKITKHQDVGQNKIAEQKVYDHTKEQQIHSEEAVEKRTINKLKLNRSDRSANEFQLELNAVLDEDEQKIAEAEKRTEEKLNENLKPMQSENTDEEQQQQIEEVEEKEGTTQESLLISKEQQDKDEDQRDLAGLEKAEQLSESDTENLQQVEERVEPEPKTEDQLTEEKEIAELTTEENNSEERQGPDDEKAEDWNALESNSEKQKTKEENPAKEEPFVFPKPPYLLGTTIKDWDEQRGSWLKENPQMKTTPNGKPRVLIVTGSQPEPCQTSTGDNFQMKSLKLKIDYARMHNYEIYYNFVWLDPLFGGFWVKLPTIRSLMFAHPEIEWFFWVDSDAVFTDMLFEAPFETYEGYNMVMWGIEDFFYAEKSWTAFNAGVFLIRNCQWTLDLIDKWSPMGPAGEHRNAYGKLLTNFLKGRGDWAADDQSALAYLMLTDEDVKAKVKLVDSPEYMLSGWWVPIVGKYEELMDIYHPGLGNSRWPWITHFTGCGPCYHDDTTPQFKNCMMNMDRAFHFADNQVLKYMGFQHVSLTSSEVIRLRNETDRPLEVLGMNPWAERIIELAATEKGIISRV